MNVDWGDAPSWIEALTTLGAFIAAGLIVRIEVKRERRAVKELAARRAADERAEQADFVAAWPDWKQVPRVLVRNGSHLPIYSVRISFRRANRAALTIEPMTLLAPGDHYAVYPKEILNANDVGDYTDTTHLWRVELSFVDAADREWVRDQHGRLTRRG